ncbi:hypothetical protein QCA50_008890 [Cerrena zonata]|uniref:G-protein coupled receptors family 1 profile domain-containing protein n=1 Tax=Cerrena zonata TaxID=2478898 RepID=A0AAW0G2F1_9APHY
MNVESTCLTQLNFFAAAAWLPPDLVPWYEADKYIHAFLFGALLTDIITASGEEYRIFKKQPFNTINIVYILSRVLTLATLVTASTFEVMPGLNCAVTMRISAWFGAFSAPTNALLFLIRVNGVYHHSRLATVLFTLVWSSTFMSFVSPWAIHGSNIGPTSYCMVRVVAKYDGIVFATMATFDTVVFLAISFHVLSISSADTWHLRFMAFIKGRGIGRLSRALLQTGQLYYMVTVGVNIASTVVVLGALGPSAFQQVLPMINLILHNAMACRVFRLLKLGMIHDGPPSLDRVSSALFVHRHVLDDVEKDGVAGPAQERVQISIIRET